MNLKLIKYNEALFQIFLSLYVLFLPTNWCIVPAEECFKLNDTSSTKVIID